jgi:hypothetical protein
MQSALHFILLEHRVSPLRYLSPVWIVAFKAETIHVSPFLPLDWAVHRPHIKYGRIHNYCDTL